MHGGGRLVGHTAGASENRVTDWKGMGVSSLMNDIELACLLLPRGKG
jgi:hypothetical protein